MEKNIIFSHESDIDGLGCVILANLAFKEIEYELFHNTEQLEFTFRKYLQEGKLNYYSNIYITDLALYDPSLSIVNETTLRNSVHVFDHHQKAIEANMNRYNFTKIVEKDETGKKCGTQLFYEYLIQNNLLKETCAIKEFVELTRLEDTWEWKKYGEFGIQAHDLAILFNSVGITQYITAMTTKLNNQFESFEFTDEEKELIQTKKNQYESILYSIISSAEYFLDEKNNKYGIVFADYELRNELADYIERNGNPEGIKYLIIAAMDKGDFGRKSYRAIEPNFDVNEIATIHGGGGHIGAAAVDITEEQRTKALVLPKREGLKYLADSKYCSEK